MMYPLVKEETPVELGPDIDEIASRLGISDWAEATNEQLLNYFINKYERTHGYPYRVEAKDRATIQSFHRRYEEYAGPIIKQLFDEHDGEMGGEIQSTSCFSKGSKWIQDILYTEVQERRKDERAKQKRRSERGGFMSGKEFIDMF